MKLYDYVTKSRPPMPGAIPRDGLREVQSFDTRENFFGIWCWGVATYTRPLTDKEISDYELAPLELGYEQ